MKRWRDHFDRSWDRNGPKDLTLLYGDVDDDDVRNKLENCLDRSLLQSVILIVVCDGKENPKSTLLEQPIILPKSKTGTPE